MKSQLIKTRSVPLKNGNLFRWASRSAGRQEDEGPRGQNKQQMK